MVVHVVFPADRSCEPIVVIFLANVEGLKLFQLESLVCELCLELADFVLKLLKLELLTIFVLLD